MKKMFSALMVLAMACVCSYAQEAAPAAPAAAPAAEPAAAPAATAEVTPEENPFKVDFAVKYANKYMSKGVVCTDGDMLFPEAKIHYKDFFAGIWLAWDLNNKNESLNIDHTIEETDFSLGYEGFKFEDIGNLTITWAYYKYPRRFGYDDNGIFRRASDGVTQELSFDFAITHESVKAINPGIEFLWDYDYHAAWGVHLYIGSSHPLDFISEKLSLDEKFEIWAGNRYFKGNNYHRKGIFNDAFTLSLNYAYNENISFGPFVQMAWFLDRSFEDYITEGDNGNHNFNWVAGAALKTSF